MKVLVVGANGTTGKQVVELLSKSNEHQPVAMLRDKKQAPDFERLGPHTVIADLEGDVSKAVEGVDAIIFAAGSGGNTGDDKTIAVDQNGAINVINEAQKQNVKRFVMLSSVGTDNPAAGPDGLQVYLQAKAVADQHLENSNLHYTIVRPGSLTNDAPSGKIELATTIADKEGRTIARADVAHVLVSALTIEDTIGKNFEILTGDTDIERALQFA